MIVIIIYYLCVAGVDISFLQRARQTGEQITLEWPAYIQVHCRLAAFRKAAGEIDGAQEGVGTYKQGSRSERITE